MKPTLISQEAAVMMRMTARTPGEKARAEYGYRVQFMGLDPMNPEGRAAFDEAERVAAAEEKPT